VASANTGDRFPMIGALANGPCYIILNTPLTYPGLEAKAVKRLKMKVVRPTKSTKRSPNKVCSHTGSNLYASDADDPLLVQQPYNA